MIEPTNKNGVSDRRAASAKRTSDVLPTEYPVVTREAYHQLAGGKSTMNLKMHRLVMGHIELGRALIALQGSTMDHKDDKKMYAKLRSIYTRAEKIYLEYPLTRK